MVAPIAGVATTSMHRIGSGVAGAAGAVIGCPPTRFQIACGPAPAGRSTSPMPVATTTLPPGAWAIRKQAVPLRFVASNTNAVLSVAGLRAGPSPRSTPMPGSRPPGSPVVVTNPSGSPVPTHTTSWPALPAFGNSTSSAPQLSGLTRKLPAVVGPGIRPPSDRHDEPASSVNHTPPLAEAACRGGRSSLERDVHDAPADPPVVGGLAAQRRGRADRRPELGGAARRRRRRWPGPRRCARRPELTAAVTAETERRPVGPSPLAIVVVARPAGRPLVRGHWFTL